MGERVLQQRRPVVRAEGGKEKEKPEEESKKHGNVSHRHRMIAAMGKKTLSTKKKGREKDLCH